jgi:hypothetical protein
MRLWSVPALLAAVVVLGACSDSASRAGHAAPDRTPPPTPVPAIGKDAAQATVQDYVRSVNRANGDLDPELAAKIETGSAQQIHAAQYKVYRHNDLHYPMVEYAAGVAAAPRFVGYPRWFFAAATDKGSSPATRDLLVFVQRGKDAPWRVAYAPYSGTASGPLAPGVDVADTPRLVALDDQRLVVRPDRLASSLAGLLTDGSSAKLFAPGRLISTSRDSIAENRRTFGENGWTGTSRAVPARTPVYAVRTTSGGALVWFALDLRHSYKAGASAARMTWKTAYGDLHQGFGLPSAVRSRVDRVERTEAVAYVPPKGKGRIQVIGSRWFPISVTGS